MDLIEKLAGISPDRGDGSLELAIIAACIAVVVMAVVLLRRSRASA